MTREVYRQIARKYGVTSKEVRREIEAAIDSAYKNPNGCAQSVHCEGDKPMPEEFITHVAQKAGIKQKNKADSKNSELIKGRGKNE